VRRRSLLQGTCTSAVVVRQDHRNLNHDGQHPTLYCTVNSAVYMLLLDELEHKHELLIHSADKCSRRVEVQSLTTRVACSSGLGCPQGL
jgi:hypothetical protein